MSGTGQNIAVIGAGIAGLSAAWLLGRHHRVTLIERATRLGGHSHTRDVSVGGRTVPVDIGFIVYNEHTYPNLTRLFHALDVATKPAPMSFGVSIDGGALEYGSDPRALFAQPGNLLDRRFRAMLRDLLRFYRTARADLDQLDRDLRPLARYLAENGYHPGFVEDHLLPMVSAIWSAPTEALERHPAASLIRFLANHGLLSLIRRPRWRTVEGGSRRYVERLVRASGAAVRLGAEIVAVARRPDHVELSCRGHEPERFDQVVIAAHADEALAMLVDADARERRLLGAVPYQRNDAVLHGDPALMPRRRRAWSSWNHLERRRSGPRAASVSYWMNRLQTLSVAEPVVLTLNPFVDPAPARVHHRETMSHPVFDAAAVSAQRQFAALQGVRRTWFCGAHFGAGFHEDALQAGLAVAEAIGPARRPWTVADESGRIHLTLPDDPAIPVPA